MGVFWSLYRASRRFYRVHKGFFRVFYGVHIGFM